MKNNIFVVFGNRYDVGRTVDRLIGKISPNFISRIDYSPKNIQEVYNDVTSSDLFHNNKLVLVRESECKASVAAKKNKLTIITCLDQVPTGNSVIYYSYKSIKKSKLYKHAKENYKLIEFSDKNSTSAKEVIIEAATSNMKKIKSGDINKILEFIGNDVDVVYSEMEKLLNYVGDQEAIEFSDVEDVCCGGHDFSIWNLLSAIGSKKASRAMHLFSYAVEKQESYEFITSMIARSIRLSLMLKDSSKKGLSISQSVDIITRYNKKGKDEKLESVYKDYEIRKNFDMDSSFYNGYSFNELCLALKNVYASMLRMRICSTESEKRREAYMMILSVCYAKALSVEFGGYYYNV